MRLLLISNSGKPLYWWCKKEIADFVKNEEVTFISAATVYSCVEYYQKAQNILKEVGVKLNHLILDQKTEELIDRTSVFLVGGGNTYQLISQLKKRGLLDKIKRQVKKGASYIGLSAGANIAGPNILTTNDWNVMGSVVFEGLGLIPFNINPHYSTPQDKILSSAEARDERIEEYLVFNKNPVVALEEQTFLKVESNKVQVGGDGKAKVFIKNQKPKEFKPGDNLDFILL
ncbi:MAG: hypothetical protein A2172_01645 [Candidatus Woykebacteria bacterium RBG_13_40_15]|uniref:Dipeptidase E n=1 Tax=Candidatus Woykebacteria bacterium RBG_13_40_15 TaxID=1802593 RepID=A0A1G1W9Z7_9BACT|nr:MAG: hypothetical protein A2172_01645 [Candidatus Woykebacteria bacterium RBG_13_40_15]